MPDLIRVLALAGNVDSVLASAPSRRSFVAHCQRMPIEF